MAPTGNISNLSLEAFFRFLTHADGESRDVETEEVEPTTKGGNVGFLWTQLESQILLNNLSHDFQRPFRLAFGFAKDQEVIRITDKLEALRLQTPVEDG